MKRDAYLRVLLEQQASLEVLPGLHGRQNLHSSAALQLDSCHWD